MGGKDHRAVGGAVVQLLDKHRPLGAQGIDHELVVDNLVAHIDRCAPFQQRQFDDLDGAVDTGAKAARGGEVKGQGVHGCMT